MLSLLWSVRLATDDPKPLKAALWAGVFAGFAAATKYNMALVVLPLLAACVLRPTPAHAPTLPKGKDTERALLRSAIFSTFPLGRVGACAGVGLLAFVFAFFAACPGAILENAKFLHDVRYEAVHVQNTDDPTFRDTGSGFVYHITHNLDAGMGLPLLLLALASTGYALYRRQRGDGLLAAFALPYYILISLAAVRYARYTIPLLPILALWAGRMLADGMRMTRPAGQRLSLAAGSVVVLAASMNSANLLSAMTGPDTRDRALVWLNTYAAAPVRVGFAVQPWFGTAPVSPYFPSPGPGDWQTVWSAMTGTATKQRIFYAGTDWDVAALKAQKPDVVVLSEYDYDDAIRLHNPEIETYMDALNGSYEAVATFVLPPSKLNGPVETGGMPSRGLPHDMTYPSPDIIIYRRE